MKIYTPLISSILNEASREFQKFNESLSRFSNRDSPSWRNGIRREGRPIERIIRDNDNSKETRPEQLRKPRNESSSSSARHDLEHLYVPRKGEEGGGIGVSERKRRKEAQKRERRS